MYQVNAHSVNGTECYTAAYCCPREGQAPVHPEPSVGLDAAPGVSASALLLGAIDALEAGSSGLSAGPGLAARGGDASVGRAGVGAGGGASQEAMSSSSGRLTVGRSMSAAPPG